MSCNPDIFKVEVCTVGTSAVMYLLPHWHCMALKKYTITWLIKLHGKTYIRELYIYTFCIMHMQHDIYTTGTVNLVAVTIATVNQE